MVYFIEVIQGKIVLIFKRRELSLPDARFGGRVRRITLNQYKVLETAKFDVSNIPDAVKKDDEINILISMILLDTGTN